MENFSFTLILSGSAPVTPERADALFEAGCDDGTYGSRAGVPYITFTRRARTLREAVRSAIRDVNRAGFDVARIEPDDLVTASGIAERARITRQYVHLLSTGERGPGQFPNPIAGVLSQSPLWSWAAVSDWMLKHKLADNDELRRAVYIRQLNRKLDRPLAHSH